MALVLYHVEDAAKEKQLSALCRELQVTPNYLLQDYITGDSDAYPDEISPEVLRAAKNFITAYESSQQNY